MPSVRLADAMSALQPVLATALAATPPGTDGVTVTLGGVPTASADPEFVIIGHDGTLAPDGSLAEVTQSGNLVTEFVTTGSPPGQQETGSIYLVAVSQTGDSADLAGRITEAQRLMAACDDACTDLRSGDIVFDAAGDGRLITRQAAQGCAAILAFVITYSAPW